MAPRPDEVEEEDDCPEIQPDRSLFQCVPASPAHLEGRESPGFPISMQARGLVTGECPVRDELLIVQVRRRGPCPRPRPVDD